MSLAGIIMLGICIMYITSEVCDVLEEYFKYKNNNDDDDDYEDW